MTTNELPCKYCISFAICNSILQENLNPDEEPTDLNITIAFATSLMGRCNYVSDFIDDIFYDVRKTDKLKEVTATELRKVYDFTRRSTV